MYDYIERNTKIIQSPQPLHVKAKKRPMNHPFSCNGIVSTSSDMKKIFTRQCIFIFYFIISVLVRSFEFQLSGFQVAKVKTLKKKNIILITTIANFKTNIVTLKIYIFFKFHYCSTNYKINKVTLFFFPEIMKDLSATLS